tara:strand:+ start:25 stop:702 length:678 start_codon:yes stop_codon:yes gene_type:complete
VEQLYLNQSWMPAENVLVFPAGAGGNFLAGILGKCLWEEEFDTSLEQLGNVIEYNFSGDNGIFHTAHVSQLADTTTGATQVKDYSNTKFKEIANVFKDSNVIILHPDVEWYIYILWMMKTDDDTNDTMDEIVVTKVVPPETSSSHYKHYNRFSQILKECNVNVIDIQYTDLFIKHNVDSIRQLINFINKDKLNQATELLELLTQYTNLQLDFVNKSYNITRTDII